MKTKPQNQSAQIHRLIDGAIDKAFDAASAVAIKQSVNSYIADLEAKAASVNSLTAEVKKYDADLKKCNDLNRRLNANLKENKEKYHKKYLSKRNILYFSMRKLADKKILIADGTPLELGGEYYGADGRKWKITGVKSPNWLWGVEVDSEGKKPQPLNREWLTVEKPEIV